MRVLVCGGTKFTDQELLYRYLSAVHEFNTITVVIHGTAPGADTMAGSWAQDHGIVVEEYEPEWHRYQRAAGPIRNQRMLDEGKPDVVIAFGGDRGTFDMTGRAIKEGLSVLVGGSNFPFKRIRT